MFSFKVVTVVFLLAIVTAATCVPHVPAPDPEVPVMNAPNPDQSTPAEAHNNAQPSKRYRNHYDQPQYIQCDSGRGLHRLSSAHHNHHEDRWFDFACSDVTTQSVSCYWSGYVNDFDKPVSFTCHANQYLAGVQSYHDNKREDRRFAFYCCAPSNQKTHGCFITGYLNSYDAYFSYTAPPGYVFTGMASVHSNHHEDRRFKLTSCKVY